VQAPTIEPAGGAYTTIFRIRLSPPNPLDEIRYTLDDTAPNASSTKYIDPIPVISDGSDIKIRAVTIRGSEVSSEAAAAWTLQYAYDATSTARYAAGSTVEGLSVSQWTGTIDWAQVKTAGIAFAHIRVADGLSHQDSKFAANWAAAKAAGVLRAPYQFFEPTQDPVEQADTFCAQFALENGDLPPVLDAEISGSLTSAEYLSKIAQWVARVEETTGTVPFIYTSSSFWNTTTGGCTAFKSLPLVIAHWNTDHPTVPNAWDTWTFWHYTDSGTVAGITGNADCLLYNGTAQQLRSLSVQTD
jgi:lysozyme